MHVGDKSGFDEVRAVLVNLGFKLELLSLHFLFLLSDLLDFLFRHLGFLIKFLEGAVWIWNQALSIFLRHGTPQLFILEKLRVYGEHFRFKSAAFDLFSVLRRLGLRNQALFVLLHLDTFSINAIWRRVLVVDIKTVIFVIAQQPLLLPQIFLLHFLDHFLVDFVFDKGLWVQTLVYWQYFSILRVPSQSIFS